MRQFKQVEQKEVPMQITKPQAKFEDFFGVSKDSGSNQKKIIFKHKQLPSTANIVAAINNGRIQFNKGPNVSVSHLAIQYNDQSDQIQKDRNIFNSLEKVEKFAYKPKVVIEDEPQQPEPVVDKDKMIQNEEYEKMFLENQDTLNVDDQDLQGIGQTTSSEISPKKPIKNVKINAFGDTGTDEIATSFTDEDLCQIEKDPVTGTLPLPIAGI